MNEGFKYAKIAVVMNYLGKLDSEPQHQSWQTADEDLREIRSDVEILNYTIRKFNKPEVTVYAYYVTARGEDGRALEAAFQKKVRDQRRKLRNAQPKDASVRVD